MSQTPNVRMPSATLIVARSYPDHVIGVDNKLPWHLRTDLQHFKSITAGHAVIMGRRTFESLGRPLPNRLNIVLSRAPGEDAGKVAWAKDVETALLIADSYTICNMKPDFFVIGGEVIFGEFQKYINKAWVTEVFTGRMNGDASFNYEFVSGEWYVKKEDDWPSSDVDDFPFRITQYRRRVFEHRQRAKEEFLRHDSQVLKLIDDWEQMTSREPIETYLSETPADLFGHR